MNPPGDTDVLKTFRGVRMQRNGEQVNQYVTMSLDPSNMYCLSCSEEHPIVQGNKPVTIVLSDENFVPMWPGTQADRCVAVLRIEGGSLQELIDLFGDVFGRSGLPEGSVVLLGSMTYLHQYGTSKYTREWTKILMQVGRSWPTVRVGPLTPVFREDVPGGVAREVIELAAWFSRMYTGNIQGMGAGWNKLITKVIENSTGGTTLTCPESYTVLLPASLDAHAQMLPHTYVTRSSRPLILKGTDKGFQTELLNALAETLGRDFQIPVGIGSNPVNATEKASVKGTIRRIILVGASNLHKVAQHLGGQGYDIVNLCVPGWMASPTSITNMCSQLSEVPMDDETAIVFDVFGNSTFRFENWDGSIFMPMKMGGGYHLAGDVTVCTDSIFAKQIEAVLPLLGAVPGQQRVVVPPQPRYLFSGCCDAEEHCTNVKSPKHAEKLLGATIHLRDTLKKKLVGKITDSFWVCDSCMASTAGKDCTVPDRVVGIKPFCANDGVHFTKAGYANFAGNIDSVLKDMVAGKYSKKRKDTADCGVSGSGQNHFWRGITSPVGSAKPATWLPSHKFHRDKPHKSMTPYGRGGGRGSSRRW